MSQLRVFRPVALDADERIDPDESEPVILPFALSSRFSGNYQLLDPLLRARTIHQNRRCAYCGYPIVEPIELDDCVLNRNRLPVPGTATLVGFRCDRCRAEWPAA